MKKILIYIFTLIIFSTIKAQNLSVILENDTAKIWNAITGTKSPMVTNSPSTFSIGTVTTKER